MKLTHDNFISMGRMHYYIVANDDDGNPIGNLSADVPPGGTVSFVHVITPDKEGVFSLYGVLTKDNVLANTPGSCGGMITVTP